MLARIGDMFRGLLAPAWIVGTARGVVEAAAMIIVVAVFATIHVPAQYLPLVVLVARAVEGVIDQIDPSKKRAPTDPLAGPVGG